MNKQENLITAIISIVLGLMLIIMRGGVIRLAVTLLGVYILVTAIMDFINSRIDTGIIKTVIAACILIFGLLFINLALYILAAALIAVGVLKIVNIYRFGPVGATAKDKIFIYAKPVLTVIAGACLLFNQGGTIAWVFILTGLILIIEGIIEIVSTACK